MLFEILSILLNIILLVLVHIYASHIYREYCTRYYNVTDIFGLNIIRIECKILLKTITITSNIIENLHILIITSILTILKKYSAASALPRYGWWSSSKEQVVSTSAPTPSSDPTLLSIPTLSSIPTSSVAATKAAKKMKVVELRAALESVGADTTGLKDVLVERLVGLQCVSSVEK